MTEKDWATGFYRDKGVAEMNGATGRISLVDPRVD